jgi:hypothetical protein
MEGGLMFMRHDWAGDDGMKSLARSRSLEEDTWDIEAHGLYLLIAGTLIWGFGEMNKEHNRPPKKKGMRFLASPFIRLV